MIEKIKKNSSVFLCLLKSAVVGVLISVMLVLGFAFLLKFVDLNDKTISIVDEIIKIVSIFFAIIYMIKKSPYKILFKSILVGLSYSLLTYIVFSALRGSYTFSLSTLCDIIISGATGAIIAVILSVFKKEKQIA